MMRWIDSRARKLGMGRSEYIRFILEMEMYREIIQNVIVKDPDRMRFIAKASNKWAMTPSQFIGFQTDFMRVLDDDMNEEGPTLFELLLWKLFPENNHRGKLGSHQIPASRLRIPEEFKQRRYTDAKKLLEESDDEDKMDYEEEGREQGLDEGLD